MEQVNKQPIKKKEGNDIANGRDEVYYKWVKIPELPTCNGVYTVLYNTGETTCQQFVLDNEDANIFWLSNIIEWLKPVQSLHIEDKAEDEPSAAPTSFVQKDIFQSAREKVADSNNNPKAEDKLQKAIENIKSHFQ